MKPKKNIDTTLKKTARQVTKQIKAKEPYPPLRAPLRVRHLRRQSEALSTAAEDATSLAVRKLPQTTAATITATTAKITTATATPATITIVTMPTATITTATIATNIATSTITTAKVTPKPSNSKTTATTAARTSTTTAPMTSTMTTSMTASIPTTTITTTRPVPAVNATSAGSNEIAASVSTTGTSSIIGTAMGAAAVTNQRALETSNALTTDRATASGQFHQNYQAHQQNRMMPPEWSQYQATPHQQWGLQWQQGNDSSQRQLPPSGTTARMDYNVRLLRLQNEVDVLRRDLEQRDIIIQRQKGLIDEQDQEIRELRSKPPISNVNEQSPKRPAWWELRKQAKVQQARQSQVQHNQVREDELLEKKVANVVTALMAKEGGASSAEPFNNQTYLRHYAMSTAPMGQMVAMPQYGSSVSSVMPPNPSLMPMMSSNSSMMPMIPTMISGWRPAYFH